MKKFYRALLERMPKPWGLDEWLLVLILGFCFFFAVVGELSRP